MYGAVPLLVLLAVGILAAMLLQRHRRRRDAFAAIKATTVQSQSSGGAAGGGGPDGFRGDGGGKVAAVVVTVEDGDGDLEGAAAAKPGDPRSSYARPHDSADSGTCRTTLHQEGTPQGLTFSEIWRQAGPSFNSLLPSQHERQAVQL